LKRDRWEGDIQYKTRSGKLLTVASRWSLQRDDRGRPFAILETDNDVTASRRAQVELAGAQAELQHVARVSTLGELMTSIAHEIKQPLSAIVTHGEACLRWMERGEVAVAEIREAIGWINRDARRAAEVIDHLRSLSKGQPPKFEQIDVASLVEESLVLVGHEIMRHSFSLSTDVPADLPRISGDRVQLQQVLINLLVNAMQAMAEIAQKSHHLCVRAALTDASDVLIEVSDTGRGIGDLGDELFDPFFTTKPDGMGMGLSICRSIIEHHGGQIFATTNNGGGATFHLIIPALS
jgi:C4-dicarboxylate-specific signal transduction histidine kinase